MMRRLLIGIAGWFVFLVGPLWANPDLDRLVEAMQLPDVAEILRDEGLSYGKSVDEDMLGGQGGKHFAQVVSGIYREDRIIQALQDSLEHNLSDEQVANATEFFESPLGQTIISLENSARRAFSDPAIEEVARQSYEEASADDRLLQQLDTYIEVNDLIDQNVEGSLSADYNFFLGLAEGSNAARDDYAMLSSILESREEVRVETQAWLYGFLMMAYGPLSEAEMEENIAFSRSATGAALNTALFEGFDALYDGISYELGGAVSRVMQASDL